MKKALPLIIICLIFVLGVGGGIFYKYLNRVQMNTSYVNGNTAGNLYNAGLFCESNDEVFFSNPDDEGKLYAMDSDGTNVHKLCNDTAMYINADDRYVYYVRNNDAPSGEYSFFSYNNNSLCRIKRDGTKMAILDEDPCIYATLIGNYIYYLHYDDESATTLYKVRIDGKDRKKVLNYYVFNCSAIGQYFYYGGTQSNGSIYRYDTANDSSVMVYDCNCYKPIADSDQNMYYLDVSKNNALIHVNTSVGEPTILTTESIDWYNVYGSYIYYQIYDGDNSRFCMIKNDGTEETTIATGTYCNIHVTSHYVYFTEYFTKQMFYFPTANPSNILPFHPGAEK